MINLKTTKGAQAQGVKVLVYGQAGAGKTTLIKTLPNPVVLSAESGLLSLVDSDIPYVEIKSLDDLREVYARLTTTPEGQAFESVALDSLSEIAEVCLAAEKKVAKDPRQAYGEMQDQMSALIRAFRDLPGKNVYFSAKAERVEDAGVQKWAPSMPGNKLGQALPYFFDLVLALRVEKDVNGNVVRALMTDSDSVWTAKNRGGRLALWELPDLGSIIKKVKGND